MSQPVFPFVAAAVVSVAWYLEAEESGSAQGDSAKNPDRIAFRFCAPYGLHVSTVLEIKEAVKKLQPRQKIALAKWLQAQVNASPTDEEMMLIAAEGARALDKREATHAKSKTR